MHFSLMHLLIMLRGEMVNQNKRVPISRNDCTFMLLWMLLALKVSKRAWIDTSPKQVDQFIDRMNNG